MSPNLSQAVSAPSTSIPTDDPYNPSKTGSGANIYQKEFGNIQTQDKFQCINAHVALAMGQATSTHFRGTDKSYRHVTTVDMLSDDIFLEMFGFILSLPDLQWKWRILLHVCRRWRQIIFSSPLRLDLQLLGTFGTPVRKYLGCWPAFLLAIDYSLARNKSLYGDITPNDVDNILAALERHDRVRHINHSVSSSLMADLFAVMEEPFPALTHLLLSCTDPDKVQVLEDEDEDEDGDGDGLVIPSNFLGGSGSRLHEISFFNIPFPTIPAILSSASDLVKLQLENVPRTPFPSPEAMVHCVAVLTRLEDISIEFQSALSTRHRKHLRPSPETWVVLPALASILYKGDNAYLEEFVARINTSLLNSIDITYSDEDFNYRVTELIKLIERSNLQLSRFRFVEIFFEPRKTTFFLRPQTNPNERVIAIQISSWGGVRSQVADMTEMLSQVSQVSSMISDVVRLDIEASSPWEMDEDFMDREIMESMDGAGVGWLELFHPFIAIKTLLISSQFTENVARAFEELTAETITQVLPTLELLRLEGNMFMPVKEIVEGLHNTFQASGRPLKVVGVEMR